MPIVFWTLFLSTPRSSRFFCILGLWKPWNT